MSVIFLRLVLLSFTHSSFAVFFDENFDFVVVGGGLAGCIVASRLSEDERFSVLLLEAGDYPPYESLIPNLEFLLFRTKYDWNYTSVPQENAFLSYPKQRANVTRGKMLGGSGTMNRMEFLRGNKLDFDNWEKNGAKGWSWKDVLPYFLKLEDSHVIDGDNRFHAKGGPISITNPGFDNPIVVAFIESAKKFGSKRRDPNGDGVQTGVDYLPVNIYGGKREDTFHEYIEPIMKCRKNLIVKTNSFVERIIFGEKNKAIGVIYSENGRQKTVESRKEVIVCAGAINSPQLLMVSGIGPKDHLQSFGIPVITDLPVGKNLHDHFGFYLNFKNVSNRGEIKGLTNAVAYINTRYSRNEHFPDIQLLMLGSENPEESNTPKYAVLAITNNHPLSRGFVKLNSSDPYVHPIIDPKYLTHENDMNIFVEGIKLAYEIAKSMKVKDIGYHLMDPSIPECEKPESDEYWQCLVRHFATQYYHFCGTCKMGSDSEAVVDHALRVRDTISLRVVDSSIIPFIPSANTQATTMMIAEKGAHFIKMAHKIR